MLVSRGYTKSHEWLDYDVEAKTGKLGISKYAADLLGDIVHVDLPEDGEDKEKGDSIVSSRRCSADCNNKPHSL